MKKVLPLAVILLAAGCQQTPYPGNPEYREFATSDLALLQMGTKCATSAEVYCRIETPQPGEPELKRYPLSAEELQLVKKILSRTQPAPESKPEALQRRWKAAGIEIRLQTINGRTLCAVSQNTICSYSDSIRHGKTLLCLPVIDMGVLRNFPTLQLVRKHKEAEEEYSTHCRLRDGEAGKIRASATAASAARIHIEAEGNSEYLHLDDEELQQVKDIFSTLEPLPAMTRTAWDSPECHYMPLPPQAVLKNLELLDQDNEPLCSIPLNYRYFAPKSTASDFTRSEGEGEVACLPDEQLTLFQQLPFHAKALEAEAKLNDAQLEE